VKEQITDNEKKNFTIYMNNCCQCAGKLKGIFGDDVTIKLDIFHAMQMSNPCFIKKAHPLFTMYQ